MTTFDLAYCNSCRSCYTKSFQTPSQSTKYYARQHKLLSRKFESDHSHSLSTATTQTQHLDPFELVRSDLQTLSDDIKQELHPYEKELASVSQYHFDGKGKSFRPMIAMLMAKAVNTHNEKPLELSRNQRKCAMIAEMIHTSSLVHDDVIDDSDTRRGKPSIHKNWGERKAILGGDYIMAMASMALARMGNERIVLAYSQILEDLVKGEFMQLGSKEDENERFAHYLKKTFKKTASLIANSCKSVAILAESTEETIEMAYQYGRNVGIAFQLVDDLLDFTSCENVMGKPTAADLKLGLATAPVLFAAQQHPSLNEMIMRRFSQPGDVAAARQYVAKSDGVEQTRYLATQHCNAAIQNIRTFKHSIEQDALVTVTSKVINRLK
ncbi:unnamed protein product [Owenia fusiformis]|uniref:All trans-polyprenyl-diphosphate synthase PDSS1 n=1 Tax=Owenia fusiformis TaxID=6347 RepID=A0A8S4N0H6_OWEFU|nr:unnamed protein product [Owenia fusiformis]